MVGYGAITVGIAVVVAGVVLGIYGLVSNAGQGSGGGEVGVGSTSGEVSPEVEPAPASDETTPAAEVEPAPALVVPTPRQEVVPVGGKVAYLTFDDGPSQYTLNFLALLRELDVTATFFVIGRRDEVYKSIVDGGHAIGLHSNTHNYATIYRSEAAFFEDLAVISERVKAQVGFAPKIMRFPGGSSNTVSRRYNTGIMSRLAVAVHERGYRYYDWNCATGDGGSVTVQQEIALVAGCSRDVLYILAHDTKAETLTAMRTIIPNLKARGYTFLPITTETAENHHGINN